MSNQNQTQKKLYSKEIIGKKIISWFEFNSRLVCLLFVNLSITLSSFVVYHKFNHPDVPPVLIPAYLLALGVAINLCILPILYSELSRLSRHELKILDLLSQGVVSDVSDDGRILKVSCESQALFVNYIDLLEIRVSNNEDFLDDLEKGLFSSTLTVKNKEDDKLKSIIISLLELQAKHQEHSKTPPRDEMILDILKKKNKRS